MKDNLRALLAGLLMLSTAAEADLWTPYDGDGSKANSAAPQLQAGMTKDRFNAAAWLEWENEGGDWIDADGVKQGPKYFTRAAVMPVIELDVTQLMDAEGFMLKGRKSILSVGSRESANPPILEVSYEDRTERLVPIADATLSLATSSSLGKSTTLNLYDGAVVAFPKVKEGAVSAKLLLTPASGAKGFVEVYKLSIPRTPLPPVGTGYGAAYPQDKGIENDPRTIYYEGWDRPGNAWPTDWWERTGSTNKPNAQWTQDDGLFLKPNRSGVWVADGSGRQVKAQCSDVMMERGTGYIGRGLTAIHCRDVLARGVEFPSVSFEMKLGRQLDAAWTRYMVKYDKRHQWSEKCEGGKAPGLAGDTTFGGNSGQPGWGVRGWSMRGQFHPICDPSNPAYGRVSYSIYSYDGDRFDDLNGGHWGRGELAALELDKWACIEQYVKVNTPGQFDGVVQLYIDGRLVFDKRNVFLRAERPPGGYGDWQLVNKTYPAPSNALVWTDARGKTFYWKGRTQNNENAIGKFWGMAHWGGKTPSGDDHQMWYDDTVVATERVGCPVVGDEPPPPPPPAEVCDDGIDNDLDGQIDEDCIVTPPPPVKTELELAQEALTNVTAELAVSKVMMEILQKEAGQSAARTETLEQEIAALKEEIATYRKTLEDIANIIGEQQ